MSIPLLIQAGDRTEFEKILLAENIEIHSPNTIRIEPKGKSIRIDQIRELRSYLVNSGSSYRQILFYSFETATIETQNSLLKILEESGMKFQFALQVDSVEHILSTIRSRCKSIIRKRTIQNELLSKENCIDLKNYLDFGKNTIVTSSEDAEIVLIKILESLRINLHDSKFNSFDVIVLSF